MSDPHRLSLVHTKSFECHEHLAGVHLLIEFGLVPPHMHLANSLIAVGAGASFHNSGTKRLSSLIQPSFSGSRTIG